MHKSGSEQDTKVDVARDLARELDVDDRDEDVALTEDGPLEQNDDGVNGEERHVRCRPTL